MSGLILHCLGPPSLKCDGHPVHVERRKAFALLVYLAVTGRPHPRDLLATLLWPDLGEREARTMLRHALTALHRAIGPYWVMLAEDRVALPAQPELWVDLLRFRSLLAEVTAHHHPPYALCDECIAALSAAVELCQGAFLAGFSLPDAPEFELWQMAEAESVQRELSAALEQLAHVHAQAGRRQYAQAIEYAQRWLALDPMHEPAHRALMRFYAWSGDRTAAQQQYHECVRILDAELDVPPEPETTALYEQIRTGRFVAPALLPSPALAHNLPPQPTPFVGRTRELAQIATQLANPECRLLTLAGPGGVGKTRLAIEAARAGSATMPTASGSWTWRRWTQRIWRQSSSCACSMRLSAAVADARRQLLSYLRDKTLLLVLDNCEHILGVGALLVEALHAAPGLKVLATSRARLNRREEWLQPLLGLTAPPLPEPHVPAGGQPNSVAPQRSHLRRWRRMMRPGSSSNGCANCGLTFSQHHKMHCTSPTSAGSWRGCRWASSWLRPGPACCRCRPWQWRSRAAWVCWKARRTTGRRVIAACTPRSTIPGGWRLPANRASCASYLSSAAASPGPRPRQSPVRLWSTSRT